jgi:hypothetical protein
MVSSGLLRRVALVITDFYDEPGASFIRVTKIGELGTTQAATSNRRTLRRNTNIGISSQRFLQEPHGVTTQKTQFFTKGSVLKDICRLWTRFFLLRRWTDDVKRCRNLELRKTLGNSWNSFKRRMPSSTPYSADHVFCS